MKLGKVDLVRQSNKFRFYPKETYMQVINKKIWGIDGFFEITKLRLSDRVTGVLACLSG
jgi:hypothetical protein